MATAAKTDTEKEVRDAIAKVSAFYQKYETRLGLLADFVKDAQALRHEVVTLLNARDKFDTLNKAAAIELEKAEREAQTRLQSVERGHQSLIDDLTKQKLALESQMAQVEKREAMAIEKNQRAELAIAAYNQKLAEINKVGAK